MPSYIAFKSNIKKARQGDYFERVFDFPDFDLTGKSAKCQVRTEPGGAVLLEMSTANSKIALTPSQIKLTCPANEFNLAVGCYIYDIQIFTSVADVGTIIEGEFEVIDQSTT